MKNEIPTSQVTGKSIPSQVILGLGVIGLGILLLLDNLGFIEFRQAIRYWPVLVMLWGAAKLFDAHSPHERLTFGFITLLGAVLTLNRLQLFDLNIRVLWPLLLIIAGGAVVYKAYASRRVTHAGMLDADKVDNAVDVTAILGGYDRRISVPNFRGGEVTAIMGGCNLDLRGSSIEGDAVLNIFAVMGGITVKCPPDWSVVLQGTPIMGGFEEKTIVPPDQSKRLIIRGYAIMGGVEVRN